MSGKTALVVIDVQAGMFAEPDPVFGGAKLLERLRALIVRARATDMPVVYIQHGSERDDHPLKIGGEGWRIHPAIAPEPGELVVGKRTPDAFHETSLDAELRARGIRGLILTGIQTEVCVDTTCRRAFSLGYESTLVADGHSTWANGVLTAQQIIAHHNATLPWFADVVPAAEVFAPVAAYRAGE
jgi:nicotinamidase-related amidase